MKIITERGLSEYFLSTREGDLEPFLDKLDQVSGLNFNLNFSLAIAGMVLKGFRHSGSSTKPITARFITTLISCSNEKDLSLLVGYLAVLLPHSQDDLSPFIKQLFVFIFPSLLLLLLPLFPFSSFPSIILFPFPFPPFVTSRSPFSPPLFFSLPSGDFQFVNE